MSNSFYSWDQTIPLEITCPRCAMPGEYQFTRENLGNVQYKVCRGCKRYFAAQTMTGGLLIGESL